MGRTWVTSLGRYAKIPQEVKDERMITGWPSSNAIIEKFAFAIETLRYQIITDFCIL